MIMWMIDSLLAISGLIILVLFIRRPVAAYFGPLVAYALWAIPAARIFMPVLTKTVAVDPLVPAAISADNIIALNAAALSAPQPSTNIDWALIALIIWLGGAAALFILQTTRYIAMRDELLDGSVKLGQYDKITLVQSDIVSGPLAFGIFKKYIAVPENFNQLFTAKERDLAIAHEIAHHKSHDLIANLCAFIFLCLTWFSPLSWFAWSKFRLDQETACDARVLREADDKAREIYAHILVRGATDQETLFLAAMSSPKTIITRLRRLKMPPISKSKSTFGKLSILVITAIALPLTATTNLIAQEKDAAAAHQQSNEVTNDKTGQGASKFRIIRLNKDKGNSDVKSAAKEDKIKIINISKEQSSNNDTKTIKKDGKIYHISGDTQLTQEQIDVLIANAKKSIENLDLSAIKGLTKKYIIITDDNGDVKTFDVKGDTNNSNIFWYENANGSEIKDISAIGFPTLNNEFFNNKDDILKCKNDEAGTEICANSKIKLIMKEKLSLINDLKVETDKMSFMPLKELNFFDNKQKRIVKELEAQLNSLAKTVQKSQKEEFQKEI